MKLKKKAKKKKPVFAAAAPRERDVLLKKISEGVLHPRSPSVVAAVKTKALTWGEVRKAYAEFKAARFREGVFLRRRHRIRGT